MVYIIGTGCAVQPGQIKGCIIMATKAPRKTPATKPAKAAPAAPVAVQAAAPAAPAAPVAVQAAVQTVALVAGKPYRTKAAHNVAWWALLAQCCATGPAPMQAVVKAGVPAHFVGYCARRGYLQVA